MVDTEHTGSRECRWTGKQSRRLYHTNNEIEFILFYLHDKERINITSCESDLLSFHQTSLAKSNWNWAMSKQWPLAFKNWDKPLPVTFIGEPNGSHSLWTNCWGKPRQACNRWSEWTGDCWQCVLCLGTAHGRKKKKQRRTWSFCCATLDIWKLNNGWRLTQRHTLSIIPCYHNKTSSTAKQRPLNTSTTRLAHTSSLFNGITLAFP